MKVGRGEEDENRVWMGKEFSQFLLLDKLSLTLLILSDVSGAAMQISVIREGCLWKLWAKEWHLQKESSTVRPSSSHPNRA